MQAAVRAATDGKARNIEGPAVDARAPGASKCRGSLGIVFHPGEIRAHAEEFQGLREFHKASPGSLDFRKAVIKSRVGREGAG